MPAESSPESYSPWTVVNVVFAHLAEQGLHPALGESGDPGGPAAELLTALGIEPSARGDSPIGERTRSELAELRQTLLEDNPGPG